MSATTRRSRWQRSAPRLRYTLRVAGGCNDLVLFTGKGLRRLLRFAERIELQDVFLEPLGRVRKVARGPKLVRAFRGDRIAGVTRGAIGIEFANYRSRIFPA